MAEPPGSDFLKTYARAMMKYSGDMRSPCSTPLPISNSRDIKREPRTGSGGGDAESERARAEGYAHKSDRLG